MRIFFLSGDDPGIMAGNFIADSIHGRKYLDYPEQVQKGILLHRKIDSYTDTHPVYLQSKHRLSQQFDKYSGVIMDIVYDHFLANNFSRYHALSLADFCRQAEGILKTFHFLMPERSLRFYEYMLRNDTLYSYSKIEGIALVLEHLSYRVNNGIRLDAAIPLVKVHYAELEAEFALFFSELDAYCRQQPERT